MTARLVRQARRAFRRFRPFAPAALGVAVCAAFYAFGLHVRVALAVGMAVVSAVYFLVRIAAYRAERAYHGPEGSLRDAGGLATFLSGVFGLFLFCGGHYAVMFAINLVVLVSGAMPPTWLLWVQAFVLYADAGSGVPVAFLGSRFARDAGAKAADVVGRAERTETVEAAFERLFDLLQVGCVEFDGLDFVRVNPFMAGALGGDPDQFAGVRYLDLVAAHDRERTREAAEGGTWDGLVNEYRNGRSFEWRPLGDPQGRFAIAIDVTDRVRLAGTEERLAAVVAERAASARVEAALARARNHVADTATAGPRT